MIEQEQLDAWVARHGPYLYHGAAPRAFPKDPATIQRVIEQIGREGIRPNMRTRGPKPSPPWGDEHEDPNNPEHADWWYTHHDEWFLHPRPHHVFMTTDPEIAYGPPTFAIDVRKLDLERFKADEDFLRDYGLSFKDFPHRQGDPRLRQVGEIRDGYWAPSSADRFDLGQQAQIINWGEHPSEVLASLEFGVIAYEGTIEPDALSLYVQTPVLGNLDAPAVEIAVDNDAPQLER